MAEILVGLITVFESLFNAAAFVGTFADTFDTAGVSCFDLALAAITCAANFGSELFIVLPALLTGFAAAGATSLTGATLTALTFLAGDTVGAMTAFFVTGFNFAGLVFTAVLLTTLATGLPGAADFTTFLPATALPTTPFAATFTVTFETGFATALAEDFAAGLAVADLTVNLIVALGAVFPTDLLTLLVVVIFKADPNFRLAAFFSVALDFFALEATRGFAGFFML